MTNPRLSLAALVCVCVLAAGLQLGGQTIAIVQGPPPPTGAPGAPGLPPPRPPLGIPPAELPRFEVASVKKITGRATSSSARTPGGGRVMITNIPLRTVINQAFGGLREYEFSGGPAWLTTDRFSINAKAETNAPREQVMLMLRALLVDRFQMKYHVEKREMQAYVLTVAQPPWKPTPRMRQVDCTVGRGATPPGAPPPPPPGPINISQMPCGGTMLSTNGIQARGVTMASFVSLLGSLGGLGVVHDRTGLSGNYHIELDASPTALLRSMSTAMLLNNPNSTDLLPQVGEGRSLGAAVSDLGLKLDRQKEMIDVLVIDSVSQPDED